MSVNFRMNRIEKAKKAIALLAVEWGVTIDYARMALNVAIINMALSADPETKAMLECIPCEGETPTAEELIAWIAEDVYGMPCDPE